MAWSLMARGTLATSVNIWIGFPAKSGSLSYEVCFGLTSAGLGQTSVIGLGRDPVRDVNAEIPAWLR
jgi:hypothetical protein